jgi:hypothetical protein
VMWRALSLIPLAVALLLLWVVTPADRSFIGGGVRENRSIHRRRLLAAIATFWARIHNHSVPSRRGTAHSWWVARFG